MQQNWHFSSQQGGTPGEPNFPLPDLTPLQTQVVSLYSNWRYDDSDQAPPATWHNLGIDDSNWSEGQALLRAGSEDGASESGVRVVALADGGDADISSLKDYSHALDFGNADEGAEINGLAFTGVSKDELAQIPGVQWTKSSGVYTQGTSNQLPPLSGALRELMQDYVTDTLNNPNGTVTLTLEGLTPGTQYETRIYSRRLDDNPRLVTFSFDVDADGIAEHTLSLDQNDPTQDPPGLSDRDAPYAVEYSFQAAGDQLTITIQQPGSNRPWILYGLTNEVLNQTSVAPIAALHSTGLDDDGLPLPPGSNDPHWVLKATGEPLVVMTPHPAWLANDADSRWIGFQADGVANVAAGTFTLAREFDLSGYDPATAQLQLRIGADNTVQNVRLNGQPTGHHVRRLRRPLVDVHHREWLSGGVNSLELDLVNAGSDPNPAGLRLELAGTAVTQTDQHRGESGAEHTLLPPVVRLRRRSVWPITRCSCGWWSTTEPSST